MPSHVTTSQWLLVLLSFIVSVLGNEDVPRYDFWTPLTSTPRFTGQYLASRPGQIHQKAQQFEVVNLFQLDPMKPHRNVLLYGSVLQKPIFMSDPSDPALRSAIEVAERLIQAKSTRARVGTLKLEYAVQFPLFVTGDNGGSEMVVLQQFLTTQGQLEHLKSHVCLGFNFVLSIVDSVDNVQHQLALGLDREGEYNVFQHTWMPYPLAASEEGRSLLPMTCEASSDSGDAVASCSSASELRILSYNVWNTNPPSYVYGYSRRWSQYEKRLDHLVDFVRATHAGIIGFQEVRYDGTFGKVGGHAQITHLVERLPGYQFVYQPAMSYINDRNPFERVEEGPAILSKFPVRSVDYLLLSRDPNDPNDAHQRLCLHAAVDVPNWGLVDVYVTHLSLSERSRERTMVEIWQFMQRGSGVTQVLLGDLNAEPQSRGIQFLQGQAELGNTRTDLKDAWLEHHKEEPVPRSRNARDRYERFTFPSHDPEKRIDYILYRGVGKVKNCDIIGQEPTDDTQHFTPDVGLLDRQSPVYASDHRGVLSVLVS